MLARKPCGTRAQTMRNSSASSANAARRRGQIESILGSIMLPAPRSTLLVFLSLTALACHGTDSGDDEVASEGSDTAGETTTDDTTQTEGTSDVGEACGDGVLGMGEECDLGALNSDTGACKTDCTFQACGDGFVGEFEACDDGNTSDLDTCSSSCNLWPATPTPELVLSQVKTFELSWWTVAGAEYYQVLERIGAEGEYVQMGDDLPVDQQFFSIVQTLPLHFRGGASYKLRGCHAHGCVESSAVDAPMGLAEAVGYFKASNADPFDQFGHAIALSSSGETLVVGAPAEASVSTGINGDQSDDSLARVGAVYVFTRSVNTWVQHAYVKGVSEQFPGEDEFGFAVALSADGKVLAVGAPGESSFHSGINGQSFPLASGSGAVFVFHEVGGIWTQQAFIKASNTDSGDRFGTALALSSDGSTLVVGAPGEQGATLGVGGDQADDSADGAGAVYMFTRSADTWMQQAYVKASNTDAGDGFGSTVVLSASGDTLAVGAVGESSNAVGIDGDQSIDISDNAGAVYVFSRDANLWTQDAYVKPHDINANDRFGWSLALSGLGDVLAVGSIGEDSDATGIDGMSNSMAPSSGAVYLFGLDVMNGWVQRVFIKASNTQEDDQFGWSVALAPDAETLAVGARSEASNAIGVDGSQVDDGGPVGAVYVFQGAGVNWAQRAYVKASNAGGQDEFGHVVALSNNAETLVVGAPGEDGDTVGVGAVLSEQAGNLTPNSGAVYAY